MNKNIEKALAEYLKIRKIEGLALSTLEGYRYHVTDFAKRIPNGTNDYRAAALEYFGQSGINNNTFNYRRKYLKCFFDWAIAEKLLDCEHPMKGIKSRKPINRIINVPNEALSTLLEMPDKGTFSGLRDYALILFSIDTGTRPNESLQLKEVDFDFAQRTVRIPEAIAKTRQSRTLPITPQTVDAVRALLSVHHEQWQEKAPVFCSSSGKVMQSTSWGHVLKHYSKHLGVDITPYCLRHVAALGMLRSGMNIFCVQKMLGHTDISMTQRYLALNLDDLKEQHQKASLVHTIMPKTYRVGRIS